MAKNKNKVVAAKAIKDSIDSAAPELTDAQRISTLSTLLNNVIEQRNIAFNDVAALRTDVTILQEQLREAKLLLAKAVKKE